MNCRFENGREMSWTKKCYKRAVKTAQEIKALAAKPDDPSSVPGTHTVGREQPLQPAVSRPPHVRLHVHNRKEEMNLEIQIFTERIFQSLRILKAMFPKHKSQRKEIQFLKFV